MSAKDAYLIVGRLGAPFGVRGWMHVNTYSPDSIHNLKAANPWNIHKNRTWQTFAVEAVKLQHTSLVVKFVECNDRTAAQAFTNCNIALLREQLPKLPTDEFYWDDLIGLTVVTHYGVTLGTVTRLLETGANDVLVIQGENKEYLVPYIRSVIKNVDLEKQKIIVEWDHNF